MIFDGHSDILSDVAIKRINGNETNIIKNYHLENLKKGGVNLLNLVLWIDPPHTNQPKARIKEIIKAVKEEFEETEEFINIIKTKKDLDNIDSSKISVFLGVEGLSYLDNSNLEVIDELYDLGVRIASLTWNEKNNLATGVGGDINHGLTELGEEVVNRLEDKGILIDVSHLNQKSCDELIKISKKPLVASHSNCRDLCNNSRNLYDYQIKAIASTGGLIGINSFSPFIYKDQDKANLTHLIDHAKRIKELVSSKHLAFGFDFCNYVESFSKVPSVKGLEDVTRVQSFISLLEKEGFKKEEIKEISYQNYLNLYKNLLKS